jgi:hypothetical protein
MDGNLIIEEMEEKHIGITAFSLLTDVLRDALDPKMPGKQGGAWHERNNEIKNRYLEYIR